MDWLRRTGAFVGAALATAVVSWTAWTAPAAADTIDPPWYDEGSNLVLVVIAAALVVTAVVTIVVVRRRRRKDEGGEQQREGRERDDERHDE